ncbi:hypothetical protein [Rhodococcus gannanensis]|uniref:Secreted protein n=1 Tax=Rhodococcus gannanensis TaxID=1960308 RepID=A0ABW4NZ47_9NOCA
MTSRARATRWCAVLLCGLLAVVFPATATAESMPRHVWSGPLYTIADGPLCAGPVRLLTTPRGPDSASVQVTGGFFGVSGTGAPCTVEVSVHWRNLDTGGGGVERGTVEGLWIPSAPIRVMYATVRTGPGLVEMWMEPHRPHNPIPPVYLQVP